MHSLHEDIVAIEYLARRYSAAASKGDVTALASTFAEDGVLVGFATMVGRPDPETVGRAAITELFAGFLPGIEFIHQMSQLAHVDIDDDRARAEIMVAEYVRARGQGVSLFMGCYADLLVRAPQGWLFKRRTLMPRAVVPLPGEVMIFG